MKYLKHLALFAAALFIASCSDDDDLGAPLEIYDDYELPQTGASAAANQRILDLYNTYGSYVLYDFTEKDALWTLYTGNASSGGRVTRVIKGDPQNVDAMLDYINDIWLKYFPADFLKNGGLPYRVFLADSVYVERDFGGGYVMKTPSNYLINGRAIIIAGMNQIPTMDEATKKARKVELISALINDYYLTYGLVSIPDEFYSGTDYKTKPTMSEQTSWGYTSYYFSDDDIAGLRNRGFIPRYSAYGYSAYSEIYYKYSATNDSWSYSTTEAIMNNDIQYYLGNLLQASDETWADYLQYDAVKRKYDLLMESFQNNYGINLRAIATE